MSRNSRKQIVGKIENYEAHIRAAELAELEGTLNREWRLCENLGTPEAVSRRTNQANETVDFKEAG